CANETAKVPDESPNSTLQLPSTPTEDSLNGSHSTSSQVATTAFNTTPNENLTEGYHDNSPEDNKSSDLGLIEKKTEEMTERRTATTAHIEIPKQPDETIRGKETMEEEIDQTSIMATFTTPKTRKWSQLKSLKIISLKRKRFLVRVSLKMNMKSRVRNCGKMN
ncbi:hypothetical protein PMAYCL1PPCAC_01457, partial [Pristionchus mayeri]